MNDILAIAPAVANTKVAQDAPGTTIVTSGDLQVHLVSNSLMRPPAFYASTVLDSLERSKRVWTLPSLWTHRTRP